MTKHLLFAIFSIILATAFLVSVAQSATVVFENLNGTGIIITPSKSNARFYVNDTIHSLTNVTIESRYIVLSDVPIEVVSTCNTTVYLNDFEPEHIAVENATIANFTIAPSNPDAEVHVYLGNLSKVPLIVYRDGKPYYTSIASEFHRFLGDNVTIDSSDTFYFADGINVSNELENSITRIAELSEGTVTVRGIVTDVTRGGSYTMITISDGTASVDVVYVPNLPVERSDEVIVRGYYSQGVITANQIWFEPPTGFSTHVYDVKVLYPEIVEAVGFAPTYEVVTIEQIIECLPYLVIFILIVIAIFFIVKKIREE